jgi:hypothetical protein
VPLARVEVPLARVEVLPARVEVLPAQVVVQRAQVAVLLAQVVVRLAQVVVQRAQVVLGLSMPAHLSGTAVLFVMVGPSAHSRARFFCARRMVFGFATLAWLFQQVTQSGVPISTPMTPLSVEQGFMQG